jgi:hypothetical protein
MSEEVREFVRDVLDGNLANAREGFKNILAQKRRDRSNRFLNKADIQWRRGPARLAADESEDSEQP